MHIYETDLKLNLYSVCHIASEMITALQAKHAGDEDENLHITSKDVMSVKVAALCHDLGTSTL